jgi:hypothetical protein
VADPVPTKTVRAPDGGEIHYPNLPGLGGSFQQPGPIAHEPPKPPVAHESWRERVENVARSAVERVGSLGHAAVDALVLDDWKTLTGARSSTLQRIEAGADLASWVIPEGKVAEIAGHAIVKAGEIAASHVAEESAQHAVAATVEHAAIHTEDASVAGTRWAERTPNQKIAGQHPSNPSTIWDRPLTAAERNLHFENANDATAFLGPATERGGELRDWHHNVEKVHADRYGQFPPERVHSDENILPVPRAAHRGEDGITAEFNTKDRRLGGLSPREYLRGKPWEEHVARGESALRNRQLDPEALCAQTRARFSERIELHDRLHGLSKDVETAPERAAARGAASEIRVEREGRFDVVLPGTQYLGRIQSVEGDRITQDIGRGNTVAWSREELSAHFPNRSAFDATMQPGNMVNIGIGRDGSVDAQQQLGHTWQSLNQQPLAQWQQIEPPHVGQNHGR